MEHTNRLTTVAEINRFMFAGNATMTLVSTKTGGRFTFKVKASDDGRVHFVSLLDGPDGDYSYLGHWRNGEYTHGRKSRIGEDAPSARAFKWFASNYDIEGALDLVEVWHEGRCGRCNRELTVPESIATGIGPECADKMGIEMVKLARPKGKPRVPKKVPAAVLRAGERAQSPTGRSAVAEATTGHPFPDDTGWLTKFARGEVTI